MMLFILSFLLLSSFAAERGNVHGNLYEIGSNQTKKLFDFTYSGAVSGPTSQTTSIYKDMNDQVVITEEVTYQNGHPVKYMLDHKQIGHQATVEVKNGKVYFSYFDGEKTKTDEEDAVPNLVFGPTLVVYAMRNWKTLDAGEDLKIRFAVSDRRETVGFTLRKDRMEKMPNGEEAVVVKMKPTSPFINALVDPIYMFFKKDGSGCYKMIGRTVPKVKKGNSWKPLDVEAVYD